jgi:hypothetical protein
MNPDLQTFLEAWTGGSDVPAAERARVLERLATDGPFRNACAAETQLLGVLRAAQAPPPRWLDLQDALGLSPSVAAPGTPSDLTSRMLEQIRLHPSNTAGARRLAWRPLVAAVAGIALGMLCTSAVFGFGARSVEKALVLLQEGFESGPTPLLAGVPQDPDVWSGDDSQVVQSCLGVKPAQGARMARLLRSDYEGRKSSKPSRQGDLLRVVDVRRFLREAAGGEVVVTLSALFNAAPFAVAERCDGVVTLYALGRLGSTEETLLEDALAHSYGECRSLDADPGSWQPAFTRLLLPPGTEFVMLKISLRPMPTAGEGESEPLGHRSFAGHFVDDVRASVGIRRAAPKQPTLALP